MGWGFLLSYCAAFAAAFTALLLPVIGLWQLWLARRQAGEEKAATVKLARSCLAIGLGCAALAACLILIFRAESADMYSYTETGRQAVHQSDDSFTVDGMTYVAVRPESLDQGSPDSRYKREPIFDYDDSPGGLIGAWNGLLRLNDHLRGNYYAVDNDAGVELVWANRRYRDFFCPADQHAQALAWYEDESHYQWVYAEETVLPAGAETEQLITLLQQAREEFSALDSMGDEDLPGPGEVPGSALHTRLEHFPEDQPPNMRREPLTFQSTDGLFYRGDKEFTINWYDGHPYIVDFVGSTEKGVLWAFTPIPDRLATLLPAD